VNDRKRNSEPKQHHYLPQCYLEGFSKNGGFWVYDIELGTFRNGCPFDTAKQKHYNALADREGNRNLSIESALSKIEGEATAVIRGKIRNRQIIDANDKCALALFVATQHYRTPQFEAEVAKMAGFYLDRFNKSAWGDLEAAQASLDALEVKTGKKPELTAAGMVEFYKSGDFKLKVHRNLSLQMMMEQSALMTEDIALLEWAILCAPEGETFITTDNPFLITPPARWDNRFGSGRGIRIPGSRKWFPLTATRCLVMFDPGDVFTYRDVSAESMREINLEQAWQAYRYVVARDEPLLRSIVEATLEQRQKNGTVWGGTKLTIR